MKTITVIFLLLIGSASMLLAAVGVLRMPSLLTRMQTTTKAVTLGVGATMLGVAIYFGDIAVTARALLIVAFFFLTTPVSAHAIARAAFRMGTERWRTEEERSPEDQRED
ncbi:MAG: monovalent cation/H(+) antiporter subunit G [Acidobacteriota bacterium]